MRGTVLGVHDGRGTLLGPSDQRLEFPLSEWRSTGLPAAGQVVDFIEENGEARAVFAVPGSTSRMGAQSSAQALGWISVACLLVGFIIPLLPTIAAFVLGVIGAGQAQQERDETALLLSRIGWIGAIVMLGLGILIAVAVILFVGTIGFAAAWHGLGPMDF